MTSLLMTNLYSCTHTCSHPGPLQGNHSAVLPSCGPLQHVLCPPPEITAVATNSKQYGLQSDFPESKRSIISPTSLMFSAPKTWSKFKTLLQGWGSPRGGKPPSRGLPELLLAGTAAEEQPAQTFLGTARLLQSVL